MTAEFGEFSARQAWESGLVSRQTAGVPALKFPPQFRPQPPTRVKFACSFVRAYGFQERDHLQSGWRVRAAQATPAEAWFYGESEDRWQQRPRGVKAKALVRAIEES